MPERVLIIQSRPEHGAAEAEFASFLRFGAIDPARVDRVRVGVAEEAPDVDLRRYSAVIMGGGPANYATVEQAKTAEQRRFEQQFAPLLSEVLERDVPYFGACLGIGALVTALGGRMGFERGEEVHAAEIRLTPEAQDDDIMRGVPEVFHAFVGHKEGAVTVPEEAVVLATGERALQMIRVGDHAYGTQFHPELDADALVLRLQVYRDHGYFPADELDDLIERVHEADVTHAPTVLRNFVDRYVGASARVEQ